MLQHPGAEPAEPQLVAARGPRDIGELLPAAEEHPLVLSLSGLEQHQASLRVVRALALDEHQGAPVGGHPGVQEGCLTFVNHRSDGELELIPAGDLTGQGHPRAIRSPVRAGHVLRNLARGAAHTGEHGQRSDHARQPGAAGPWVEQDRELSGGGIAASRASFTPTGL